MLDALIQNVIGNIHESLIKLGYADRSMTLYYPPESIKDLINTDPDIESLTALLTSDEFTHAFPKGIVEVSREGDRFIFRVPAELVRYVYENAPDNGFLKTLTETLSRPDCDIEQVLSLFRHYSAEIEQRIIQLDGEETILAAFPQGIPDSYCYLFHEEMGRLIYHRFTRAQTDRLLQSEK